MIKKIIAMFTLCVTVSFFLVGCKNNSETEKCLAQIQKAQSSFNSNESCHILATSTVKTPTKKDANTIDFIYKFTKSGTASFNLCQYDANKKLLSSEYSDGEKAEQWLLGKGLSVLDSSLYSKEKPHSIITLLTNPIQKSTISSIKQTAEKENTKYVLKMDAKKINDSLDKDKSIVVNLQEITFILDAKQNIISYLENITIDDKIAKCKTEYNLTLTLSDHNAIKQIPTIKAEKVNK
ncbi:MAG: hypothetical protein RSA99_02065 [Oscillospiraceae bacterium]